MAVGRRQTLTIRVGNGTGLVLRMSAACRDLCCASTRPACCPLPLCSADVVNHAQPRCRPRQHNGAYSWGAPPRDLARLACFCQATLPPPPVLLPSPGTPPIYLYQTGPIYLLRKKVNLPCLSMPPCHAAAAVPTHVPPGANRLPPIVLPPTPFPRCEKISNLPSAWDSQRSPFPSANVAAALSPSRRGCCCSHM